MMTDTEQKKRILRKLTDIRARTLTEYPFFGNLMMHLRFGLADCGTAFTDMERIVFDPEFALRLKARELQFVMIHEVLHCALKHCIRGWGLHPYLYNVACDIVVNSNIMAALGVTEFFLEGIDVMHLAPDGKEGYEYNAEEVYHMLLLQQSWKMRSPIADGAMGGWDSILSGAGGSDAGATGTDRQEESEDLGKLIDCHDPWMQIPRDPVRADQWEQRVFQAGGCGYGTEILPPTLRDVQADSNQRSKLNWREILHDFIQLHADQFDYTFTPADRRFAGSEFILPSFHEVEEERTENIWFCVDTSGSVSNKTLSIVLGEIRAALLQLPALSGLLSYFDTVVSEPVEFDCIEELEEIRPVGGGGTSFHAIFQYMQQHMQKEHLTKNYEIRTLPRAVIVLTDGYAPFPAEKEALGVPVLWIIIGSKRNAPWGTCIHM